ncbi:MAG: type II toxin-antitoxin system HipA family toxin [Synergistaceae bacterium]|jgi:serine/threonine-protein kinase HipA|nr:type II toxin-antitoxin system HipA family toxin [Synergistaceae bacterium]
MNNKVISVFYHQQKVGRIAQTPQRLCAFEYDGNWLSSGFPISPFKLPLQKQVFIAPREPFDGNFGVFNDSLPDGWGRLLIDRLLLKKGLKPAEVSVLDRLALVGKSGMGALEYQPEETWTFSAAGATDIRRLAEEVSEILHDKQLPDKTFFDLVKLGGSSGGARPKALIKIQGEDWIVKFPARNDHTDIGHEEYQYSLLAREAGLDFPETRLLDGEYFAVKRFDRRDHHKIHMLSLSALLDASHRFPSLDYVDALLATLKLTRDYREAEKMYRLMCFNVLTHNRDDHAKNFSFLYIADKWVLSPAYDLTYAEGPGGEHSTAIDGEGKSPSGAHILSAARKAGLDLKHAQDILAEVSKATQGLCLKSQVNSGF